MGKRNVCLIVACLVLSSVRLFGREDQVEDPGPFLVGTQGIVIADPASGLPIDGKLYYPALTAGEDAVPNAAGGPYPLVGFQHGWLLGPDGYDLLSTHIASWGFFVVSVGTQTGVMANMTLEAQNSATLMNHMDLESQDPTGQFFGLISDDDWSAVGHSMGGGGLFYLIGFEPRVRVLVSMQPYKGLHFGGTDASQPNIDSFTGDVLMIAGEVDCIAPAATMAYPYYLDLDQSARRIYHEVEGMGHNGPTDITPLDEPLSAPEQQRMHALLVTGFLRAQIKGEENLFAQMIGEEGQQEPVAVLEAITPNPILWSAGSTLTRDAVATGMTGTPASVVLLAASLNTISLPTAFGILGLDPTPGQFALLGTGPLDASGLFEISPVPDAGLSGQTLYTQGLLLGATGGLLTRTAAVLVP